jgi:hypothetical protein
LHQALGAGQPQALAAPDFLVRVVPARAGLRPGPRALGVEDAGRGPPVAPARQAEASVEHGARAVEHAESHPALQAAADRLPRWAGELGSSAHAAPARHSHHSAWRMVGVDHGRGRPVRAGGSMASMVVARRTVALARTASLMAGA